MMMNDQKIIDSTKDRLFRVISNIEKQRTMNMLFIVFLVRVSSFSGRLEIQSYCSRRVMPEIFAANEFLKAKLYKIIRKHYKGKLT